VTSIDAGEPCAPHVYHHRLLDVPYQGEPSPLEPPDAKEATTPKRPAVKKPTAKKAD
jgi:hypothetical protein